MKQPFIAAATALIAGIIAATLTSVSDTALLLTLCLVLAALLFFIRGKNSLAAYASVTIAFFIVGALDMNVYRYHTPSDRHISQFAGPDVRTVEGVITETPHTLPDKTELTINAIKIVSDDTHHGPVHGKVFLTVKPTLTLKYGDLIRFKTRLRTPSNFNNPGGFDYSAYLRYRGVLVRGFVADASNIVVLREGYGHPILMRLEAFRDRIKQLIADHQPSPIREIIQASILGNQKEIPRDIMDKFNLTGTSHIIAISGFNMGIIALFTIFLVRTAMKAFPWLLLRFDWQHVSAVIAAILVIFYTFIAGAGISVVRATLMILVFMFAVLLGKMRDLGNTLALAALIILLAAPYDIYDISFQLSFSAVMALLFITPRLTRMIPGIPSFPATFAGRITGKGVRNLLMFAAVTVSATLGTLPLILYYFNRFSTIVLISNLLVVPILGIVAIPVCMAIIIFFPFSETLAVFFCKLAGILVKVSLSLVEWLSAVPYASLVVPTPTLWEIMAYYLLILAVLKLMDDRWERRKAAAGSPSTIGLPDLNVRKADGTARWRRLGLFAGLGLLVVFFVVDLFFVSSQNRFPGLLKMTAIDVGQGSSTLFRFPNGKVMLIDGGGFYDDAFDVGKYVVAPFLWHERISTVHIIALTHPHPDHMNGLKYVLNHFHVQEVWTNGDPGERDESDEFIRILQEKKITPRLMSRESHPLNIDGVTVSFLNPAKRIDKDTSGFDETNDRALVMRLAYRNVRFLLPSDISSSIEGNLIRQKTDLQSQVLLIPHHGSRRSSSDVFLEQVRPDLAVLSVGKNNLFRLPHPDTLSRYATRHIPVFRTDHQGAVTVSTDGREIKVQTCIIRD